MTRPAAKSVLVGATAGAFFLLTLCKADAQDASYKPQLGRCHMGSCSWALILSKETKGSNPTGSLFELAIQGGTSTHKDGDYKQRAKIEWNGATHRVWIFCSKRLPAVMSRSSGSLQVTIFNFDETGVPGALESDARAYFNACHDAKGVNDIGSLAKRFGYNFANSDFSAVEQAIKEPEDILRVGSAPATTDAPSSPIHFVANTAPPDAFLALRTAPSSSVGRRIALMPNGTQLLVQEKRADGWWLVRVTSTGEQGWALSRHGNKTFIECCVAQGTTEQASQRRTADIREAGDWTPPAEALSYPLLVADTGGRPRFDGISVSDIAAACIRFTGGAVSYRYLGDQQFSLSCRRSDSSELFVFTPQAYENRPAFLLAGIAAFNPRTGEATKFTDAEARTFMNSVVQRLRDNISPQK